MALTKEEWIRRKRLKRLTRMCLFGITALLILLLIIFGIKSLFSDDEDSREIRPQPVIEERLLTESPYTRPGEKLVAVNGVVVHAAPDAGLGASANRDYYESLKDREKQHESVHFIVGIDGEILQLIPLTEISLASGERNADTVSVEYCYPEEGGKPTDETYQSMTALIKWLADKYDFNSDSVLMHYDVSGKKCPEYFIENPAKWLDLEEAVDGK